MRPKRVLIADDDPALLSAMRTRLEAEGFEVIVALDGYQALAVARAETPDVMVLDVNMPAGSGFSVQDRIRAIDELSDTPVIFITGETPDRIRRDAIEHGVSSILHKPFDGRELTERVRAAAGIWISRRPCPTG
ncbi:MAG: response regulator [Planctomycetota bacterium]|jgi:DNA-binding response OmpR family regulator